jgi:hypothetical protein
MLEKKNIAIREVTAAAEEGKFVVRITVHNPAKRTLYAYASPRRILYDSVTGLLTICLHDHHVEEGSVISRHLPQPRIVPLEGNADSEVTLSIPPIIRRVRAVTERGDAGGVIEELRVSEASEVRVEVAHQDTPFYYDPKQDKAHQLKKWGKVIASGTFKIRPGREHPPRMQ